ncbi:hypothetical protein JNJ66_01090 [Candidatus Saccharibacteria bacterium]|nr:hypothetical protein [Candidatus Saccharibacteria bacterium]
MGRPSQDDCNVIATNNLPGQSRTWAILSGLVAGGLTYLVLTRRPVYETLLFPFLKTNPWSIAQFIRLFYLLGLPIMVGLLVGWLVARWLRRRYGAFERFVPMTDLRLQQLIRFVSEQELGRYYERPVNKALVDAYLQITQRASGAAAIYERRAAGRACADVQAVTLQINRTARIAAAWLQGDRALPDDKMTGEPAADYVRAFEDELRGASLMK